jgi:hemolysin activation/secretion protein
VVGGVDSLRGLERQRYTGDASAYGNGELRLHLRRHNGVLFPRIGVFGLADVGRVFVGGESSDRWHTAVGGGLWLSFMTPANVLTFSAARSEGGTRFYVQSGFMF